MNIAFTADVHLTTRATHPERFNALEKILAHIRLEGLYTLIIAGDLLDSSLHNYTEFESVVREYKDVHIVIFPEITIRISATLRSVQTTSTSSMFQKLSSRILTDHSSFSYSI
ncbi:MAG: metallophosphoesterase [Anaerolineales bacterium]